MGGKPKTVQYMFGHIVILVGYYRLSTACCRIARWPVALQIGILRTRKHFAVVVPSLWWRYVQGEAEVWRLQGQTEGGADSLI